MDGTRIRYVHLERRKGSASERAPAHELLRRTDIDAGRQHLRGMHPARWHLQGVGAVEHGGVDERRRGRGSLFGSTPLLFPRLPHRATLGSLQLQTASSSRVTLSSG